MPNTINCCVFIFYQQLLGLIAGQFRSDGNARIHIEAIINFPLLISNVTRRICNIVQLFLNRVQLLNVNNAQFHENLAVMFIDGISNPGVDLSIMSDEFRQRGIIWVIVGLRTPVFKIWDLYLTLARDTGGEYMLIENALRILSRAVRSAVLGENTLRQAFRHINTGANGQNLSSNASAMTNDSDETDEPSESTDGLGDLSFDHGLSE